MVTSQGIAEELSKLNELRMQGILTDAEFEARKRALLGGKGSKARQVEYAEWSDVPQKNKWWFQALLTLVVIPIGLLFLLLFKSYKRKKGEVTRVGAGSKFIFSLLALGAWVLAIGATAPPSDVASDRSAGVEAVDTSIEAPAGRHERLERVPPAMVACDSPQARAALASAIQNNANSNIDTLRLLDLQDIQEISYDADTRIRRCAAMFVLNAGRERSAYVLSPASRSHEFLVEIVG